MTKRVLALLTALCLVFGMVPAVLAAESDELPESPVATEPVETEPIETEPVETEPVETEPVETEPVETEPVETEPVPTEPEVVPDDSGTWGDNLTWELHGTKLYIYGEGEMDKEIYSETTYPWNIYKETLTEVYIGDGITNVADYAFNYFKKITAVRLPDSITVIGENAFLYCELLERINVPAALKKLGSDCFSCCARLSDFPLPDGLAEIPSHAFNQTALVHVDIPDSVTSIGDSAFSSCRALESITIPNSVTRIGSNCFWNCTSLTSIDLPDGITTIENCTFHGSGLVHIEIPSGVTRIDEWAFRSCAALESVILPEGLAQLGGFVFGECASLTTIDLPESLTYLGSGCFDDSGLVSIVIPSGITKIDSLTFSNCPYLEAILIPDSVTEIQDRAFENTSDLVIYCYNLSYAHLYAVSENIPTAILEEDGNTPVYDISVTCSAGCSAVITMNPTPANRYVLLEIRVEDGYTLDSIRYQRADDPLAELSFGQIGDTIFTFFMPASDVSLEIYCIGSNNPFRDVKESAFYYDAVMWAVSYGVTSGVSETRFAPNDSCTRAQVVTFLWRAAGEPEPTSTTNPFRDVKSSAYYYKAVLWAVENGITTGISKTSFGPNNPCTRAQVVTFLWRAAGKPDPYYIDNPFTDVEYDDYYYDPVRWAVAAGITTGISDTRFGPGQTCTRGQVVTFLYRFLHG